jgi:hypothetical protein
VVAGVGECAQGELPQLGGALGLAAFGEAPGRDGQDDPDQDAHDAYHDQQFNQ